jgi:hypothetical protein
MKLTPGYAFQLYYWDYVIGIVLGSLAWGLTLGNLGGGDLSFLSNIGQADQRHMPLAIAGGAVFNVANLLLVVALPQVGGLHPSARPPRRLREIGCAVLTHPLCLAMKSVSDPHSL